jgi:hypothetical protein
VIDYELRHNGILCRYRELDAADRRFPAGPDEAKDFFMSDGRIIARG